MASLLVGAALLLVASTSAGASVPGPAVAAASGYRLPLDGPARVMHGFERPPEPWAAGHRGVDLAGSVGRGVLAPAAGVVTFAGRVAGRGVVTVAHADGLRSSLEPVAATVHVGDRVSAGAVVGTLTAEGSHCAPTVCLHWGVRDGPDYLDPLDLVPGLGPMVLLPLTDP